MDEAAVKNELNCSICLDTYTDPKILQCFHVYCQKCLVKLVVRDQQGKLSLSCPICRQVTPVPVSGTAGLQSAFHINRFLEILKKGNGESASPERVDSTAESPPLGPNSALFCSEHCEREVELFCETCGKLLCMKCVIKGGSHHSHDYKDFSESYERYREEVTLFLDPMEEKMSTITELLIQLDWQCKEITDQQAAVEADIRDSSKRLHEIINKKENELISQLDHITRRKLKSLATQRDQIETLQAQLNSCLEFTRESLRSGVQPEVLAMKKDVIKQVTELTASSHSDIFTLSTDADVVFTALADAAAVCESYGRVYALDSPDPSKCIATGRGTEEAVVGEKATAEISTVSFRSQPCIGTFASASFEVELVSELTSNRLFGSVEPSTEHKGQYVVSYQPTVKGWHQLHIKADGQHIRGSPFSVTVKLPVEKLGTPIQTLSHLRKPWGLAVNGKGEVAVTERSVHRVSVFSSCGKKLRSFGKRGSSQGEFQGPSGVAVDGEGNVLVADRFNHRIQKFTADGHFLMDSGSQPLKEPHGIAYSTTSSKVYVADTDNHRIQVLNSDLKSISMFGKEGSGKGQFKFPSGVATDRAGRVYVADTDNNRVQVFTAERKFLRMFGKKGKGEGELDQPGDVVVDASGLVYVSEYYNHRVSVFTSEGKFVTSFGSKGSGAGQFDYPLGLAVDDSGVVYVCDSDNHNVQLF